MGLLAIRFGQEAMRSWRQDKQSRRGLWLLGGIVLALASLWIAFVTYVLYLENSI